MKPIGKIAVLGLCVAVTAAVTSLFSPTYARYLNVASTVVKYQQESAIEGYTTLSADGEVYDFGVWTPEAEEAEFGHTLRIADTAALSGVLRFSWDDTTRSQRDMTVYIDGEHYTSVQNSGYTDYTVSAPDGDLQIPFSLIFSSPSLQRVAVLDVSWYPDGGDEPTLFARYLLAVMPSDPTSDTIPTFVEDETYFMTNRLLQATITAPADCDGVFLTSDAGALTAQTRYCSDAYPGGVTLLRDSAIYVENHAEALHVLLDLSAHLEDDRGFTLVVGASDMATATLSRTPATDTVPLTVSVSDEACVVSAGQPLTITLTEASGLRDSDWSATGDTPMDLTWQMYRRVGDTLVPVTVDEEIAVAVEQTSNGGTLTVSAPDGLAAPGTYLLTFTQTYFDHPILETPIWFFIDYR